ncbi:hypothetical protein [Paraflavitalea speifideaquila]|uniref:hypothetical protein n=1 Tax=Paraflavitalea speifideaquila TaxID=3076558 RepID=UPI0028F0F3B3|nr:hypothetical protein [Paraflavitalea speifideiaquila]
MKIWEKKQELIGTVGLNFYLFRAVRNNCLSFLEKKQKNIISTLRDEDVADLPGEKDRATVDTGKDYDTLLKEAMDNLSPSAGRYLS